MSLAKGSLGFVELWSGSSLVSGTVTVSKTELEVLGSQKHSTYIMTHYRIAGSRRNVLMGEENGVIRKCHHSFQWPRPPRTNLWEQWVQTALPPRDTLAMLAAAGFSCRYVLLFLSLKCEPFIWLPSPSITKTFESLYVWKMLNVICYKWVNDDIFGALCNESVGARKVKLLFSRLKNKTKHLTPKKSTRRKFWLHNL